MCYVETKIDWDYRPSSGVISLNNFLSRKEESKYQS